MGIAAHYGIPAISTGDIFRANVKNQTAARARRSRGSWPTATTSPTRSPTRSSPTGSPQADAADGWLLDGYPRTAGQVDGARRRAGRAPARRIDAVISLVADTEVLVDRLLKRAELEGRADDNEETIRNRMEVYTEATDPLLATYRDRGLLVEVDGIGERRRGRRPDHRRAGRQARR